MRAKNWVCGFAVCAALGPFHHAFAQETITGNVGGGTPSAVVIGTNVNNVKLAMSGLLKLKLHAVTTNAQAGVRYDMSFCVGPERNPCGLPTDIVFTIPGGTSQFVLLDASLFDNGNVMTVGVGTTASVEYEVSLE